MRKALALFVLTCSLSLASRSQQILYSPVPRETVESRLGRYRGKDSVREATLWQMFAEAGCDDQHLSQQAVKGSKLANVICVLPGTSGKVLIVGAHYDHVSDGDGVVDNWSGASLLPSLYQALKDQPRKHTFIFIGFTDEEKGLIGSHYYAQQMTKEQLDATDAMVNMDTLGLAPTEVWVSHSEKLLIQMLYQVAKATKLPVSGMNVDNIGTSDSEAFASRKIPRITIHSLTQDAWAEQILHSPKDKLKRISLEDYYQSYNLVAAYLAYLDVSELLTSGAATKP